MVCVAAACQNQMKPLYAMRSTMTMSRISVANNGFGVGTGAWTFEFWVRIHGLYATSDAANPSTGHLFDMNEDYAAYAIRPILGSGRKFMGYTYNDTSGPWNFEMFSNPIPDGDTTWHHFAMVYDGASTGRIFLDGAMAAKQLQVAPVVNATSPMAIGHAAGYGGYETAPVSLGGIRYSKTVRYAGDASFVPANNWVVDANTIAQYLTKQALGATLVDEAGGDNVGTIAQGWVVEAP
jgi:hypothetical protein